MADEQVSRNLFDNFPTEEVEEPEEPKTDREILLEKLKREEQLTATAEALVKIIEDSDK